MSFSSSQIQKSNKEFVNRITEIEFSIGKTSMATKAQHIYLWHIILSKLTKQFCPNWALPMYCIQNLSVSYLRSDKASKLLQDRFFI